MEIIKHNPLQAGVPLGQFRTPISTENFTFGQVAASAFAQENDLIGAMTYMSQPAFKRDETFNSLDELDLHPEDEQYDYLLARAQSRDEYLSIKSRIAKEQRDKQILASNGVSGFIMSAVAGIISPTVLIPLVGPTRGLKGAAQSFALAATAISAQEAVLYNLQETRTEEQVAIGIAAGTILGGLLGTAFRYARPDEFRALEADMAGSRGELTISRSADDGSFEELSLRDPNARWDEPDLPQFSGAKAKVKGVVNDADGLRYSKLDLAPNVEVRFTKSAATDGSVSYDMAVVQVKDGVAVPLTPPKPVTMSPIASKYSAEGQLTDAIKAGELDEQVTALVSQIDEIRRIVQPTSSSTAGAQQVNDAAGGIKRWDTRVGRKVDALGDAMQRADLPFVPRVVTRSAGRVVKTLNDPVGMLAKLNPLTRQLDNPVFPASRAYAAKLRVPGIRLEGGYAKEGDAASRHEVHYAEQVKFLREYDASWANYITDGQGSTRAQLAVAAVAKMRNISPPGKMPFSEFKTAVFYRSQTAGEHAEPAVNEAAKASNNYFKYFANVADEYHGYRSELSTEIDELTGEPVPAARMFEKLKTSDDGEIKNYMSHLYDSNVMEKDTVGFLDDFTEHFAGRMRDDFEAAHEKFSKVDERYGRLIDLTKLDDVQLADRVTTITKLRDDLALKFQAPMKQVADLRKALKAAGEDRKSIAQAVKTLTAGFGDDYAAGTKNIRDINSEIGLMNKLGAGVTEKQAKVLEDLDKLDEMQTNSLGSFAGRAQKLLNKLDGLSRAEARTDAEIASEYSKLRGLAEDLEEDFAKMRLLDTNFDADKAFGRLDKLMSRISKKQKIDFAAMRELRETGLADAIERVKTLNGRRAVRAESLKEKAAKLSPEDRVQFRADEAAAATTKRSELREAFERTQRREGAVGDLEPGKVEFTAQARVDAQELFKTIMGQPMRVVGADILTAARGPQIQRRLNVPLEMKMKWLVRDPELVVRSHGHTMFPDMELYRMTGSVNGKTITDEVTLDYDRALGKLSELPPGAAREEASVKLRRDYENTMRDWGVLIDRFRHQRSQPTNANGFGYRMGRFVMQANVTTKMGGVVIASLPDAARPVFRYGVSTVFSTAWKPLVTDLPRIKSIRAEAERFGIANDPILHGRAAAIADVFDNQATRQNMAEKGMEFLANKTGFVALFDRWTAEMKYIATNAVFAEVSHAVRVISNQNLFSAKEVAKATESMQRAGLGQDMAKRIWAQYQLPGGSTKFKDDFSLPNTEAWDDFDALMTMKSTVNGIVNDLIVTPGLDRPSWMDENMAYKMVGQFRSFTFTSTTRVLMSGLQEPDMAYMQGVMFSLALGALSYYTWATATGGKAYEEMTNASADKFLYEAVGRSGVLGILSEGQKIGEQIPGISEMAIFGAQEGRSQRANSLLGAILGPSYGTAEKLATVLQGMNDPTQATFKAARSAMVPYQNVFYLRGLLDKMQNSMFDTFDIPERRNN